MPEKNNINNNFHSTYTTSSLFKGKSLQGQPLHLGGLLPPQPILVPSHSQMSHAGQWKHKSKSDPESSTDMISVRKRPYLLKKNGKSSQCWRDSNREHSRGCRQHFAVGLWTAQAQSQHSLLPRHLSDTRELYATGQTDCDLFWSTEFKELFGSQTTYLWALFSFVMKCENRETKLCTEQTNQRGM